MGYAVRNVKIPGTRLPSYLVVGAILTTDATCLKPGESYLLSADLSVIVTRKSNINVLGLEAVFVQEPTEDDLFRILDIEQRKQPMYVFYSLCNSSIDGSCGYEGKDGFALRFTLGPKREDDAKDKQITYDRKTPLVTETFAGPQNLGAFLPKGCVFDQLTKGAERRARMVSWFPVYDKKEG